MEVFVARHPVFDGEKKLFGYQLEFRSGFEEFYSTIDTDRAKVDFLAYVNFSEQVGPTRGFLTFPRGLLINDFPRLLSHEDLVVVLGEDLAEDTEILPTCQALKEAGYLLMIDEIGPWDLENPLVDCASIVGVDFGRWSLDRREPICRALSTRGIHALAKGVGTIEEFCQALTWGYTLFHGDFIAQPIIQPGKEISTNELTYLQMLDEVNKAELQYDKVEDLIKQDVAMTYALLRFVNSAWFGVRHEIHSLRQALVLLGPEEVRVWASLLVLDKMATDKPKELLRRSLTRAKAAEQIAPLVGMKPKAAELFLMGMFSCIDALTDIAMADVLEDLPFSDEIKRGLLGGTGEFGLVHQAIIAYEKGQWDGFSSFATALDLDEAAMPEAFRTAIKWANQVLEIL